MSDLSVSSQIEIPSQSWLERPILGRLKPAAIALGLIILLSLGLHFYRIESIGNANPYYTAAVKSMLQSWHNFFFVAAEPGGSVTVDKPPLGLWIEAAFAAGLGVSGFSVTLPNILAGVISIPLLYGLVKKQFGTVAGLVSALVLALTPVSLAVDRTNTIDSMLILVLILAAWAFVRATESGRLRHLLLGAFLVGLGFNIKMLQAFLPLPAFYAVYFFGAKTAWGRKALNLVLATVLLLVVSLAWPVAVDLTPPSQRPYVGSSTGNSEIELITGYNGLNRLLGMMRRPGSLQPGRQQNGIPGQPGNNNPPPNNRLNPNRGQAAPGAGPGFPPGGAGFPGGGPGGFAETGQRGVLRFFQPPLAKEMSWLLPFALGGLLLVAFSRRAQLPVLDDRHRGLILWGGWLITCLVFFSAAGFFHNYYLATLSPALAALVGAGFAGILRLYANRLADHRWWAGIALLLLTGATLSFQLYLTGQFGLSVAWTWAALGLFIAAILALTVSYLWQRLQNLLFPASGLAPAVSTLRHDRQNLLFRVSGLAPAVRTLRHDRQNLLFRVSGLAPAVSTLRHEWQNLLFRVSGALCLAAILLVPGIWSARTVATGESEVLPAAYGGETSGGGRTFRAFGGGFPGGQGQLANQELIDYLRANTQGIHYMVAVPSSMVGASLVLATGRPVLYMGGFSGADPVIDAAGLDRLVREGQLRFVLYENGRVGVFPGGAIPGGGTSTISEWLKLTCRPVTDLPLPATQVPAGRGEFGQTLYRCGE